MSVEQIKAWLLSKGVTLWASWDLSQPERLQEAAEWFKTQMNDCHKWVHTNPAYQWRMLGYDEVTEFFNSNSWDVV